MNSGKLFIDHLCIVCSGHSDKARCEPGWAWKPRVHPDYNLWYVVSGKGEMRINGDSYPISGGSCFLLRPGDHIRATQHMDDRLTVIYHHFEAYNRLTNEPVRSEQLPPRHIFASGTYSLEQDVNRLLEITDRNEEGWMEEFGLLMKLILFRLYRDHVASAAEGETAARHKRLIDHVIRDLRDNIGSEIDYGGLAAKFSVNARYLSQLFKKVTGLPLKEYRTKLRMERALSLLQETSLNISQVADALGYKDIYHFSKQFKLYYKQAPTAYRFSSFPARAHFGTGARVDDKR